LAVRQKNSEWRRLGGSFAPKQRKKERGVGFRLGRATWRRRGGVDVRSAREVGVQCRQGRRRGGGGDRSEENRGVGRHAWAACGEHGLAGEEGKWAGPKRNTAVFLIIRFFKLTQI
jgi:hypothetical protein